MREPDRFFWPTVPLALPPAPPPLRRPPAFSPPPSRPPAAALALQTAAALIPPIGARRALPTAAALALVSMACAAARTAAALIPPTAVRRALSTAAALALVSMACAAAQKPAMQWQPMEALNAELPEAVRIHAGNDAEIPLRAWYVAVRPDDDAVRAEVLLSDDPEDRRERLSAFAADTGACVLVNGGYFSTARTAAFHAGLLVVDGAIEAPATASVVRGELRYETARAALGFVPGGYDIAWVTSRGGALQAWPQPPPHRPGAPARLTGSAHPWPAADAIGAGPALVSGGRIDVTTDEEVFFGSAIPDVHPRTAAGVAADGSLLLLVVDGRQPVSRGVDLQQLAAMMVDIGAREALNLDGGGSSGLVVNGALVNRPSGLTAEREVMSAIGVFCD